MPIKRKPKPCRIADLVLFIMANIIPMVKRPKQNPIMLNNPDAVSKSMLIVYQRFL
ncbi:MAG: hypothetical protein IMZ58_09615 [Thermoplasmata archaeon]|nr:hypothetical protein [Thermoplasmata archaeon]